MSKYAIITDSASDLSQALFPIKISTIFFVVELEFIPLK